MTYYRLNGNVDGNEWARIGIREHPPYNWVTGDRFEKPPPEPIRLILDPECGKVMPDIFLSGIQVFSERLIDTLGRNGVDNFDSYRAEINDPRNGAVYTNYSAVNIIGCIACVKMDESEFDPESEMHLVEFSRIALDEKKIGKILVFRLAENPTFILVSEKIKQTIERVPLVGVTVVSLDDPSAY